MAEPGRYAELREQHAQANHEQQKPQQVEVGQEKQRSPEEQKYIDSAYRIHETERPHQIRPQMDGLRDRWNDHEQFKADRNPAYEKQNVPDYNPSIHQEEKASRAKESEQALIEARALNAEALQKEASDKEHSREEMQMQR